MHKRVRRFWHNLLHDLRHLNRDLRLLAVALVLWGIGEGIFFYYQPLYLAELGASPKVIGGIIGAGGMLLALSHLPAGWLADRIGRRQLMWAPSLPFFALGVVLYYASGFVMAPMNSYITAARGDLSVGRALTLLSATYNLGAILGPLFGGLLVSRLPMRGLYGISASLFVVSTVTVLFLRPQPVVPRADREPRATLRAVPGSLWGLMALTVLTLFAANLPQPLAPNYLHAYRAVAKPLIGTLGSLSRLGIVARWPGSLC